MRALLVRSLVIGCIVSCIINSVASSAFAAPSNTSLQTFELFEGSWWGTLDTPAKKLRLTFKLRYDKTKKSWSGDLGSPDQMPGTLPIDGVTVDGDTLNVDMRRLNASFSGRRAAHDRIQGTFTQGIALPLELQRGEPPVAKTLPIARPQEPKPPFPYEIERVSVDNREAGLKLGCTLTRPRAPGKYPALITITGSGQQDRDEALFGHKPFWVLADALSRHGVGVLRCDDRGKGESTGDFARSTSLDFAGDVRAGIAWLKARPDVDATHIGLVGHSEGGLIAPMVASQSKDVAFIILLAGPGLQGDELVVKQVAVLDKMGGAADARIAADVERERKLFAVIESEKDDAVARKKLVAILSAMPDDERAQLAQAKTTPGQPTALEHVADKLLSPWFRTFLTLDPKPYLRKVKVPVLALNGSRDIQVPPVEDLAAIGTALAGNADVTIKELPGLNHLFQRCQRCTVDEYGTLEETMSPTALQLIVEWVQRHTK